MRKSQKVALWITGSVALAACQPKQQPPPPAPSLPAPRAQAGSSGASASWDAVPSPSPSATPQGYGHSSFFWGLGNRLGFSSGSGNQASGRSTVNRGGFGSSGSRHAGS